MIGLCGSTHSFGTSSPAKIFCTASSVVRHWKFEYTGASAVIPVAFHLRRKLSSSSPVMTG